MNSRLKHHFSSRGFSLAEVAIAIGIAGVALISVLGLMPALTDSERISGLNTALPQLATQAMGKLRSDPYPAAFPQTVEMYFSENAELLASNDNGPMRRTYRCVAELDVIPALAGSSAVAGGVPDVGNNSCLVKLTFTLAAEPNSAPKIFHAALSR